MILGLLWLARVSNVPWWILLENLEKELKKLSTSAGSERFKESAVHTLSLVGEWPTLAACAEIESLPKHSSLWFIGKAMPLRCLCSLPIMRPSFSIRKPLENNDGDMRPMTYFSLQVALQKFVYTFSWNLDSIFCWIFGESVVVNHYWWFGELFFLVEPLESS